VDDYDDDDAAGGKGLGNSREKGKKVRLTLGVPGYGEVCCGGCRYVDIE